MIRLQFSIEPVWLDLYGDVKVKVLPFTSALFGRAREAVGDHIEDGIGNKQRYVLLSIELAKVAIIDWEGVGDVDGNPIDVTAEAISALMDFWLIHEAFSAKYLTPGLLMGAEKKGSAPLPSGTSAPAGAQNIAANAKQGAKPVSTASKPRKPTKAH